MNYAALLTAISDAHQQARAGAAGAVNRHLILRNWLIGAYLIEFEQNGEDRAEYGAGLLKRVSADLRQAGIPGTSPDMLERMRNLYLYYPQLAGRISAPVVRKLPEAGRVEAASQNSAPAVRNSGPPMPRPLPAAKLLELSWTHLADLVRLDDPWKRAFYENECLKGNWSKRQLQRQIRHRRPGPSTLCLPLPRGPAEARATPATHRNRPHHLGTAPSRTANQETTMISAPICLRVKGPFACFTRPEMKVQRVSHAVITPGAVREPACSEHALMANVHRT